MADTHNLSGLSFFTVNKYDYQEKGICDFREVPRPHYCMGYILEGNGIFEFGEKKVTVNKGDIIFVPVGSCYRSIWTGSPDVSCISMHFFFLSHLPFPGSKRFEIQKLSPLSPKEFEPFFIKALESFDNGTFGIFNSLSCFYGIMSILIPRLVSCGERKYDERIERTILYLEQYYMDPVTIKQLAAISHMSVSHFHACFKEATEMTPIEYRNHIRIRYAIMSLLHGNESIEEISDRLGFESVSYFRRVFKKETGCAPSKYIKEYME